MNNYGIEFLKSNKYFLEFQEFEELLNDGTKIKYIFDQNNNITFYQNIDLDIIEKCVKEFKTKKIYDYYWFWNENKDSCRLFVFRTFGENKRFIYNSNVSLGSEWNKGKLRKLADFSFGKIDNLFDMKEVIDYFYKRLWDLRIQIAQSIKTDIMENQKIIFAQNIIDRVIFIYFLGEKSIIWAKDENGNKKEINIKKILKYIMEKVGYQEDFYKILMKIFFEHLNDKKNNDFLLPGDSLTTLYIPYLNGGLFREKEYPLQTGGYINERYIKISKFDWSTLINELNSYYWIIDEFTIDEEEDAQSNGNLTPEILGHIYEKFVITINELTDFNINNLTTTTKGDLKQGNKKIGAFYTPEKITNYMSENAINTYLKNKLNIKGFDNFDSSYQLFKNDKKILEKCLDALLQIKVLDPAVGSGHFLMSIADLLYNWRKKCGEIQDDYTIRKNIISENLYGVDLMEGATEICKLRLWLWLISVQQKEKQPEPLPNIDFNILKGNSLLGFIDRKNAVKNLNKIEIINLDSSLLQYENGIIEYKKNDINASKLKKDLSKLHDDIVGIINKQYVTSNDSKIIEEVSNDHSKIFEKTFTNWKISQPGLKIEFNSNINEGLKEKLSRLGFRSSKKSTKKIIDNSKLTEGKIKQIKSDIEQIIKIIDSEKSNIKEITIDRNITDDDLIEKLFVFHWLIEYPKIFQTEDPGFDIIIGNPPYGSELTQYEKEVLSSEYSFHQSITHNSAMFFIYRSKQLLKNNGILTFIIPKSVCYSDGWHPTANFLVKNLKKLIDVEKAFEDVLLEQVIFIIENRINKNENDNQFYISGYFDKEKEKICEVSKISKDIFNTDSILLAGISEEEIDIIKKLKNQYHETFGKYVNIERGLNWQSKAKIKQNQGTCPIYRGNQIEKYFLKKPTDFINLQNFDQEEYGYQFKTKILNQLALGHVQNPFPHFYLKPAFDVSGDILVYETISCTFIKEIYKDKINPKFILLLNNSKLFAWILYKYVYSNAIRSTRYDENYISKVIVPPLSIIKQDSFIIVSDILLFLYQYYFDNYIQNNKFESNLEKFLLFYEDLANLLVYELYFDFLFESDFKNIKISEIISLNLKKIEYNQWFSKKLHNQINNLENIETENLNYITENYEYLNKGTNFKKKADYIKNHKIIKTVEPIPISIVDKIHNLTKDEDE